VIVLLVGIIFAGFASVAAVFTAEYLDSSFCTPRQVNEVLGIPVLAWFPRQAS
jgi:capsular polysaccharide biosynthesis protein